MSPLAVASLSALAWRARVWLLTMACQPTAVSMAWRAIAIVMSIVGAGCATLPGPVERQASYAQSDIGDTTLARIAAASAPADPQGLSGFRLFGDGEDAFQARLALVRRAEKTLDIQYYLIASDATGLEFLAELRAAAGRGVRVRILVDDLYATGQDDLFASLAAVEHIEVRMFNPLPVRGGGFAHRIFFSLHEFRRINHRMHNKLFIADGSFAIVGGRNIADEYFDRGGSANFIDMDAVATGPVVHELAGLFDRFWNCDLAYPIQSLAGSRPPAAFDNLATAGPAIAPIAARPQASTHDDLAAQLAAGRVDMEFGAANVLADAPQKAQEAAASHGVAEAHLALIRSARTDVLIASPYFIPDGSAMRALDAARAGGARVSMLTNSLATTDEPLVHLFYARHRPSLLNAGVSLHELMPQAAGRREDEPMTGEHRLGGSLGRLHAKLTVVDDERLFIGSMNMDRRSDTCNTEAGLVIRSVTLARAVSAFIRATEEKGSYRLGLARDHDRDRGHLVWQSETADPGPAQPLEPAPGVKIRRGLRFVSMFVNEDLL